MSNAVCENQETWDVQQQNETECQEDQASQVCKTTLGENILLLVVLSVSSWVRIMQSIVLFRVVSAKIGSPGGRIRGERELGDQGWMFNGDPPKVEDCAYLF